MKTHEMFKVFAESVEPENLKAYVQDESLKNDKYSKFEFVSLVKGKLCWNSDADKPFSLNDFYNPLTLEWEFRGILTGVTSAKNDDGTVKTWEMLKMFAESKCPKQMEAYLRNNDIEEYKSLEFVSLLDGVFYWNRDYKRPFREYNIPNFLNLDWEVKGAELISVHPAIKVLGVAMRTAEGKEKDSLAKAMAVLMKFEIEQQKGR